MWSDGGGIADNLSREFRAMSSERDRRWGTERGGIPGRNTATSSGYAGGGRATSPPLRYSGQTSRSRGGSYEGYQPIRPYAQDGLADENNGGFAWKSSSGSGGLVTGYALRGTSSRSDRAEGRGWSRAAPYEAGRDRSRTASKYGRNARRGNSRENNSRRSGRVYGDYGDEDDEDDSYSYSYSYSSSGSVSEGDSTDSGYSAERHRRRGRPAQSQSGARSASRQRSVGRTSRGPVRYTPTGPTGTIGPVRNAEGGGGVQWVDAANGADSGTRYNNNNGGVRGAPAPLSSVGGGASSAMSQQQQLPQQQPQQAPGVPAQMPTLQPSGLLRRVVEAVAYYRGVAVPPAIPSEVTLAFDEYVSRGSTMLKFLPHGPPHSRYFIIRFLDVVPGGRRHGRLGRGDETVMPHAVFAWYRNTSSRHMIRFLPLHDLMEVKADGSDHPYVQRRTVQPGMLRGPRTGFSTNYVYADYILQFRFRSRLSRGEETLALKTANRTQHLAWLVVGTFISQIGGGGTNQFH